MTHQIFHLPKESLIGGAAIKPSFKVNFYLTGTTTPTPVYTTSALSVAHTQPVQADSGGVLATVYLDPSIVYKASVYDQNDVLQYTVDPVNDSLLSQSAIGLLLYPRTAAEISAGVTPTNYAYPPGYEARFGVVADSTTDNTTALQNLINGSAGYAPIVIRRNGSGYYKFTGRVTVPANTTIILMDGPELRWTATAATGTNLLGAATRPGFELLGSNVQIIGSGTIRGPSSATFVSNEIGIFSKGTSSASRFSNFTLGDGVLLEKWGYAGVALQYWDVINLPRFRAFDCGHAGFFAFSCGRGKALGVDIDTIGPGDGSGQAYGFSLTHDSTGYSTDPSIATPRLVANPFCNDWEVTGTIANVPTWQGFDAHGAYDTRVHHMATYNCRKGISIANSSGDAANYAGENNSIDHVYCTTKKRDGSATSVSATDRDGITLSGGSTVKHANVSLDNFVVDGYGDTVVSSLSVQAYRCTGARITNGRILNWKGYGIGCANGNGIIDNVLLGPVASTTNSVCVYHDYSVAAGRWDVRSVRHRADGGSVASEGLRIATSNSRSVVAGNDFSEATSPYAGDALILTKGASDPIPTLSVTGTPTSISLSTPELNLSPRVRVTLDTSGGSTITDITGAYIGQIIELYAPTTNVTVFDRTNAVLAGGANWSSSQYDTLVLECVNTSGTKFVEISRSANS